MSRWKNSKRVAVVLTFDIDAESLWISRNPENRNRPITLSQGEYGPKRGVPRILRLLKKWEIETTFFVTGWTVERYPESVEKVYSMGHEIAHHGYHHEWLDHLTLDKEKMILERGITLLKDVTGIKPLGYRSPSWEFSTNTLTLLTKYGFRYSSNMMNSDLPYRYLLNGTKTDLIELPVHWILDDAPFFLYGGRLTGRIMMDPSQVYSIWRQEFQAFYEEALCYVLTMHPQLIGRPSRIKMLDRLIRHMKKYDIWCAKAIDVAEFWTKTNP